LPDGLFWIVRVPDDALEIKGASLTIRVRNVAVTDTFTFFNPLPPSGNVPAVTSFEQTYTRMGSARRVKPISTDPKSPFNWAGEMWMATSSCTFTAAYRDGSLSVRGNGTTAGQFSEMGFERNGFFLTHEGADTVRIG
jgi:hypothetical protein